jgi:hypothetical protein
MVRSDTMRRLLMAVMVAVLTLGLGHAAQAKRGSGLEVNVDIGGQTMNVYVNGELRHRWRVSTGRDG